MNPKKSPADRRKSHGVALSEQERGELRVYTDAKRISFSSYMRTLAERDRLNRENELKALQRKKL